MSQQVWPPLLSSFPHLRLFVPLSLVQVENSLHPVSIHWGSRQEIKKSILMA